MIKPRLRKKIFSSLIRLLRSLIFFVLAGILFLVAAQLLLPLLIDLDDQKSEVAATVSWLTGRKIEIGKLNLNLIHGIAVECHNTSIYEEDGKTPFAQVKKLFFVLKPLPLLHKEFVIDKVVLNNPSISLHRSANRISNIQSLFSSLAQHLKTTAISPPTAPQHRLRAIRDLLLYIHEAKVDFHDDLIGEDIVMEHVNLVIPRLSLDEKIPIRLSMQIPSQKTTTFLEVRGDILNLPADLDLKKIIVDLQFRIRAGDLTEVFPFFRHYRPAFRNVNGNFTLKANYLGNLDGNFKSTGDLLFQNATFDYPSFFKNPLTVQKGSISFGLSINPQTFELRHLQIQLDELELKGSGQILDWDQPQERALQFDFFSDRIPVKTAQQYVPVNAIPKDMPEFEKFFQHDLTDGSVTHAEITLRGKLSDWNRLGFQNNADLIGFRTNVEHLMIRAHEKVEPLIITQGIVTMKKGKLSFVNLNGTWGEGKIYQGYGTLTDLYNQKSLLKLWVEADLYWQHASAILAYDIFDILPKFSHLREGSGLLETRLNIRVPIFEPEKFTLDGIINGKNISFQSPNGQLRFRELNSQVRFVGNQIHVPQSNFRLGDSLMKITGSFTDYYQPKIQVNVQSDSFDFLDLFNEDLLREFRLPLRTPVPTEKILGSFTTTGEGPMNVENWSLNGEISFSHAHFKNFLMSNMQSKVDLSRGVLSFPNLRFQSCGGRWDSPIFSVDVHPLTRGNFTLEGTFRDIDLETLLEATVTPSKAEQSHATGKMNLSGQITSNLLTKYYLAREAKGRIQLEASRGHLVKLKTLATVLRILNFRFMNQDLVSFPYEWAQAQFHFRNGVVSTDNFYIDGKLGSLSGSLAVDLLEKRLDGTIGIRTYAGADWVLGSIPLLGGTYRGLTTTYFSVDGPLDDPRVSLTALHAIKKGASGIFKGITGGYTNKIPP